MKENNMFLTPTTADDIEGLIRNMKVNKGVGPNSIPTKILKDCKLQFSKPLSDMINTCFTTGIFLSALKVANIIPIHKKGDKLNCNNYRPISLFSNISKSFEKMMHIRLTSFLKKNKVLSSFQFGFRNKHSTNHVLISLTEMIRSTLDNDQFACGVFIDLQKGFDTVDHKILLFKMNHYEVKGILYEWFKSYLTNRQQFTTVTKKQSELSSVEFGVPQGSILGLLLFLIYINDINKAIIFSSVHHFTDDTNILYVSSSLKDINNKINHDLSNLVQWFTANKISLKVSKSEIIIFKSHSKQTTKHLNFRLSGQKIIPKNHTKYLGIVVDEHLTCTEHMAQLRQKLNRTNGLLAKLRHQVSSNLLKTIYFVLFDSHLRYAAQVKVNEATV